MSFSHSNKHSSLFSIPSWSALGPGPLLDRQAGKQDRSSTSCSYSPGPQSSYCFVHKPSAGSREAPGTKQSPALARLPTSPPCSSRVLGDKWGERSVENVAISMATNSSPEGMAHQIMSPRRHLQGKPLPKDQMGIALSWTSSSLAFKMGEVCIWL